MPRMRRDWVPCQSYGAGYAVLPLQVTDIILVAPRDVTLPTIGGAAPTEVAVVETENEVATTRVIGQVLIINGDSGDVLVVERIRVGILDNAGATAFFADSFVDDQGANEPFLWQRVSVLPVSERNMDTGRHPYWSSIDVRVGRRLSAGQALFYSVESQAPVGGDSITVRPFLRTLARQA